MTSDNFILACISGFKLVFDTMPVQTVLPGNSSLNTKDEAFMHEAILELLKLGAIERCTPCNEQFLSSYFLVHKSNSKQRFVLNLKKLNKFLVIQHFKMEDIRTAAKLISKNCFMGKLDLQNAYYLIPIDKESRKFLRFKWQDMLFEFVCLPFGLNIAPWLFTKIMKPVILHLRRLGQTSVVYLDDWLCISNSFKECEANIQLTCKTLESLGFVINTNIYKSILNPVTRCQFLGIILDSESMTLELTEKKRAHILSLIKQFQSRHSCRIREFAQFVGNITAACLAVNYGWLYSKMFERQKYLALLRNRGNYDAKMQISIKMKDDFAWWESCIMKTINPIRQQKYKWEIFSDASLTGWGAACNNDTARGIWNESERELHINVLELIAAFFVLRCFAKEERDCEILLRIDNTTAISYINRMGGIQFPTLNSVARQIWQWCEERNLWIFASYIASRENKTADAESRVADINTEWELAPRIFDAIINKWGFPKIHLFASRLNAKCEKFCSWHRDPESFCIDAFTLEWGSYDFYAFPPFSLILRVLKKIQCDQAQGIVVVPKWETQPWFPLWQSLLIGSAIYFEPDISNLLSPCRSLQHPLASKLTLMAGLLSGRRLEGAI